MWIFKALGLIAAVLSLISLIKYGFAVEDFAAPFQIVIQHYERWMHTLFGWMQPHIRSVLDDLKEWFGWELDLYWHWKHVFVLMWLYFGAETATYIRRQKPIFAVVTLFWGGIVALAASIASGTQRLDDPVLAVFTAAFPVAGVFLYEIGLIAWKLLFFRSGDKDRWLEAGRGALNFALPAALIGGGTLLAAMHASPALQQFQNPGLIYLAGFVAALALYRLMRGLWTATFDRKRGDGWWSRFVSSGSTRIATLMFTTFLGTAAFFVANAGLHVAGL